MSMMPQGGGGLPGLGTPSPEELLGQIRDLLDQYLALGDNTPVAAQAQTLADAIDQSAGGSASAMGDLGSTPQDAGGIQPHVNPENMGAGADSEGPSEDVPGDEKEPPPSASKTFGGANKNALDRLKKRNRAQGN